LVKRSKSGGQMAKITQMCFSKVQQSTTLIFSFVAIRMLLTKKNKKISYKAKIWNVPKHRWCQFFTISFIEVLLVNKHRGTVKYS